MSPRHGAEGRGGGGHEERGEQPLSPRNAGVDIGRLADKVYRLMLADLRLARARGAGIQGVADWNRRKS